jgi:phage terminase Nu1 subunit (DNA packaging protein)
MSSYSDDDYLRLLAKYNHAERQLAASNMQNLHNAPTVAQGEDLELAAARYHLDEAQARIAELEGALKEARLYFQEGECITATIDAALAKGEP